MSRYMPDHTCHAWAKMSTDRAVLGSVFPEALFPEAFPRTRHGGESGEKKGAGGGRRGGDEVPPPVAVCLTRMCSPPEVRSLAKHSSFSEASSLLEASSPNAALRGVVAAAMQPFAEQLPFGEQLRAPPQPSLSAPSGGSFTSCGRVMACVFLLARSLRAQAVFFAKFLFYENTNLQAEYHPGRYDTEYHDHDTLYMYRHRQAPVPVPNRHRYPKGIKMWFKCGGLCLPSLGLG